MKTLLLLLCLCVPALGQNVQSLRARADKPLTNAVEKIMLLFPPGQAREHWPASHTDPPTNGIGHGRVNNPHWDGIDDNLPFSARLDEWQSGGIEGFELIAEAQIGNSRSNIYRRTWRWNRTTGTQSFSDDWEQ